MADNEYLGLADDVFGGEEAQPVATPGARAGMYAASVEPVRGESIELARELNLPVGTVERNFDELSKLAKRRRIDYGKLATDAPLTNQWLADPVNASAAQDDIDNLTGIEQAWDYLKKGASALGSGLPKFNEGVYGAAQMATDTARTYVTEPLSTPINTGLFDLQVLPNDPLAPVSDFFSGLRQGQKGLADRMMPKADGSVEAGVYSGLQSLGQNMLTLPAAVMSGNPGVALAPMVGGVAGQEYGRARDKGVDYSAAAVYATSQAAVEFATEKLPMGMLIKDLEKNTGFISMFAKQLAAEMPGEQIATILQDLNEWAVLNPDKSFSQYLAERPNAALQTAVATVVGTGGMVTTAKAIDKAAGMFDARANKAAKAMEARKAFERMNKAVEQVTVKNVSPSTMQAFSDHVAQGGSVYVDANQLANALQQSGIDINQAMADIPSIGEQFQQKAAAGQHIKIPAGEFLTKVAGTNYAQAMLDHLKTDPNDWSQAEADEVVKGNNEAAKAEVERIIKVQRDRDAHEASADIVRKNFEDQLNTANRFSKDVNKAKAQLLSSFFSVMAARLGITPEKMADMYQLQVKAEAVGQAANTLNQGKPFAEEKLAEFGQFKTGQPVTFDFAHNTESATKLFGIPKKGAPFGRFMEPSGRYVVAVDNAAEVEQDGKTVAGTLTFNNPLVLNVDTWKQDLFDHYKKRGKALSKALIADGYDGVVTGDKYGVAEILDLTTFDEGKALYQSPVSLPDTIDIDGQQRPTRNSNGQPIAQTEQGVRNFYKWFGDSKVVDDQGRPLRVFHGTASDITAFDIGRSGESTGNTGFYGAGAYFSEDADYASGFSFWARRSDDQAPNVVPVYLSLKNPAYINITPRSQAASEKSRATAEKIISTMIARGTDQAVVDKLQGFVSENKFEPFMGTLYNALGGGTGTTALLKEAGFDGVTIYGGISGKEKLAEAVAFDPTQIKSAVGNNGEFDPQNPNILYQGGPAERDLIITHNLTESNLLHAVKMGGIPVPSLAVTKAETPLAGFGDITLIGPAEMADPKGYAKTQVYGADIYSPRYPSVERELDKSALAKLRKEYAPLEEKFNSRLPDQDDLEREGQERMERSPVVMAKFLADKGIEPAVAFRPGMNEQRVKRLESFGLGPYLEATSVYDLMEDEGFFQAALAELIDQYQKMGGRKEIMVQKLRTDEDTQQNLVRDLAREIVSAAKLRKRPDIDVYASMSAMEKQIQDANLANDYQQFVVDSLDGITKSERIFQGFNNSGKRKYIPHTLENVVKILKKELRGGEGFNYGVGSLRAKFTPQFKSVADIRKNKERLLSEGDFDKIKDEINDEFFALVDLMKTRNETAIAILEDAPKMGLEAAAKDFNIELSESAKQKAVEFLEKLHHLPTAYFEAKILRDVAIEEFKGAAVPDNTSEQVRSELEKRGLKVVEYKANDNNDRARAVKSLSTELNTLFQEEQNNQRPLAEISFANDITSTPTVITLLKGANLSSFIHESGHFFLEVLSDLASKGLGSTQKENKASSIIVKANNEVDRLVAKHKGEAEFGPYFKGDMQDHDRGAARIVQKYWDELSGDVQEFLMLRNAKDWETGEIIPGYESIRGTHIYDLRKQLEDMALQDESPNAAVVSKQLVDDFNTVMDWFGISGKKPAPLTENYKGYTLRFNPEDVSVTAEKDGLIVGTFGMEVLPNGQTTLADFDVKEGHRRKGIATAMQDFARKHVNQLTYKNTVFTEDGKAFASASVLADTMDPYYGGKGSGPIDAPLDEQKSALEIWRSMTLEEKRPYHEQFARGFEVYAWEGKAPSLALAKLFQRFRAWMLDAYKKLLDAFNNKDLGTALDVKLSNEVRSVMDRMLATQEQIYEANAARGYMPAFATKEEAEAAGVDWDEYRANIEQADQDAITALESRSLRDMQWFRNAHNKEVRRLRREAAGLRREARIAARAEVLSHPVYRVMQFLTAPVDALKVKKAKGDPNAVDPATDTLLVAVAKLGGLQRDMAVDQFGLDPGDFKKTPVFGKPILRRNGGMTPDGMAEALAQLGYMPSKFGESWDMNDLGDYLHDEGKGIPHYSETFDYRNLEDKTGGMQDLEANPFAGGRIDRESMVREYGGSTEEFPWENLGAMLSNDGIHPDVIADQFGFQSGDEMVRFLMEAKDMVSAIEDTTDRIMFERHGDLTSKEALDKAADEAIHNKMRAKVLATEANALAKTLGARGITAKAARVFAERILAGMKILDIKPSHFAAEESKAAARFDKARKKGNVNDQALEKRNQLVNNIATRLAYDAEEEVAKAVRHFKQLQKPGSQKSMRGEYLEQLNILLERFELRGAGNTKKAITKANTLPKFADWLQAKAEELGAPTPDMVAFVLDGGVRKPYRDMTLEEFRSLVDAVKQLEHLARREQKQYMEIRGMELEQEKNAILDRLRQFHPEAFDADGKPKGQAPDFVPSLKAKLGDNADAMLGEFLGNETIINILEGGDLGLLHESFFKRISDRSNWRTTRLEGVFKKLEPLFDQYSVMEKRAFSMKDIGGEIGIPITREKALGVALLVGNAEGRERVRNYGWTDEQIIKIIDLLDERDKRLAEGIWDLFDNDLWPDLKALNERTAGKAPPKVEATPFTNRLGTWPGGYMRLKYDTDLDERAYKFDVEQSLSDLRNGMGMTGKTPQGTSQERKKGVLMRPRLDFGVFVETVTETVHDIAYREAVSDVIRLLNDKEIQAAIKQSAGVETFRAMRRRVAEVAARPQDPYGFIEKFVSIARRNTIVTLMSGVGTAFQNFTGYIPATGRVNAWLLSREVAKFGRHPKKMYEFATSRSEYMRHRFTSYEQDLVNTAKNLTVNGSMMPDTATFLALMGWVDRGVSVPVWNAAFAEGMEKYRADTSLAVEYADHVVRQTQGSGRIVDKAGIMTGHPLKTIFTMFYSYFNSQLQQLVRAGLISKQEAKTNPRKAAGRVAMAFVVFWILPALVTEMFRRTPDDEDDEEKVARYAKGLLLYPAAMFPIVRDIAPWAWDKYVADSGWARSFKMSPVESAVEGVAKGIESTVDIGKGDGDQQDVKNLLMGVGFTFGVPGKLISDFVTGTYNFATGEAGPQAMLLGPEPTKK